MVGKIFLAKHVLAQIEKAFSKDRQGGQKKKDPTGTTNPSQTTSNSSCSSRALETILSMKQEDKAIDRLGAKGLFKLTAQGETT